LLHQCWQQFYQDLGCVEHPKQARCSVAQPRSEVLQGVLCIKLTLQAASCKHRSSLTTPSCLSQHWLGNSCIPQKHQKAPKSTHYAVSCSPDLALLLVLQAAKLQSLYAQAQADLDDAEGKVVTLSAELEAAQDTAEKLRREMRNLQVRPCVVTVTGRACRCAAAAV
jgi:hypothetical protein